MKVFDVSVIAELALQKLKDDRTASRATISRFKTVGFKTIIQHFERTENLTIDNSKLRDFLEEQHDAYMNEPKLKERWKTIRRSAELLMFFATTGRVDMPPLPSWSKRYCQLCIEPTEEQLSNNDNIYGLIWRTRIALKSFGYNKYTIKYYDQSGFSKILEAHRDMKTEEYSRKLCAELVLKARNLVSGDNLHKIQAIRKTSALLDEFHRYGTITPSQLSVFDGTFLSPGFETLVEEYGNEKLFSGQFCQTTIRTAKSVIKGFLLELEKAGFYSLDGVELSVIGDIITKIAENNYKSDPESLLLYVRDFLKYLYEYDIVKNDLSIAVPKMAAKPKKIYQGFTHEEIKKLLSAVDCETSLGKRDYAIMTLAVQTGLRYGDILALRLGDIDWRNHEINIIQSKTGVPLTIPLETESGNAIGDYILNARPKCDISNVFLTFNHPLRAMSRQTSYGIINKYMSLAGIDNTAGQRYGFHSFRRAFGTQLLETGTSVYLLSQLLGQTEINSTAPYISISEKGLKECCLSTVFAESEAGAI